MYIALWAEGRGSYEMYSFYEDTEKSFFSTGVGGNINNCYKVQYVMVFSEILDDDFEALKHRADVRIAPLNIKAVYF